MKRIFLCFAFVMAFISQAAAVENPNKKEAQADLKTDLKREKNLGFFVGLGLGGGLNFMMFNNNVNPSLPPANKIYGSAVGVFKIGGYWYLQENINLRYYLGVDINFVPGSQVATEFLQRGFYVFTQSTTLNVDLIYDFYSKNQLDIGLIVGVGEGQIQQTFGRRAKNTLYPTLAGAPFNKTSHFEHRVNLGLRVMFDKKYALEAMARIPTTNSKQLSAHESNRNSAYYLTFDFVLEL